ncbi:unnamed protein product [Alopecurus aequalis]
MPARPKPSAKPWPPATSTSHAQTTNRLFIAAAGCDDDDDFQSPPRSSRARHLKPSNGAVSRHLRKKLTLPSPYSRKENLPVSSGAASAARVAAMAAAAAETLAAGSRVGPGLHRVPEDKEATGGGICSLFGSGPGDPKLGATEEKGLAGRDGCKGSSRFFPNSTESRVLEPGETSDLGVRHCEEVKGVSRASNPVPGEGLMAGRSGSWLHGSTSIEENVDAKAQVASRSEAEKNKWSRFGVDDGNCHSHSIESELLVSSSRCDFEGADCKDFKEPGLGFCSLVSEERKFVAEDVAASTTEPAEKKSSSAAESVEYHSLNSAESIPESQTVHQFEADDCDDFEIGTQLNELINLCMDGQVDSHRNSRASPVEGNKMDSGRFESVYRVHCPLCGSDISELSEELQLAHTNNCLDKDEPAKESDHNRERGPCTGENTENKCVVEWLRNLGLSKYEGIFTKEEVDWETLQWLTEEDLLGMGITSLGPRKKIIHALGELRKKNDQTNYTEADMLISENTNKTKVPMNGNKLITEFFRCSSSDQKQRDRKVQRPSNLNNQKNSSAKVATSRSRTRKAKVKDTPIWCCIPGTPFRVDAFRYLRGDCSHWFLTHFHLDHYQGLTKNFCHGKIYCSAITANLVHHKIGVSWDRLHVLPLNKRITVAGVNLTCFDANHCPGSIIILFEPANGYFTHWRLPIFFRDGQQSYFAVFSHPHSNT